MTVLPRMCSLLYALRTDAPALNKLLLIRVSLQAPTKTIINRVSSLSTKLTITGTAPMLIIRHLVQYLHLLQNAFNGVAILSEASFNRNPFFILLNRSQKPGTRISDPLSLQDIHQIAFGNGSKAVNVLINLDFWLKVREKRANLLVLQS